jgi:protocatechuate 3,4-dioxygenase beta subunit
MPVTRRRLVRLLLGTALGLAAPLGAAARAVARTCGPTPRQTMGPFYPARGIVGVVTDLTRTRDGGPRARGEILYLDGRVVDAACRPIAGAEVEIWQADIAGRYNHPDESPAAGPLDPNFRYWGEAITDADGRYAFTTIVPAPYSGRTAHVHVRVRAAGRRDLVTQMYFAGHPLNERDGLVRSLAAADRARVMVDLRPADDLEAGAKRATFEIGVA